ncbi:hypothetical protein [Streptomyces sp. NRRL F-5527]|nr:hypothetical protein [Streptomyces sp. NRRL F-5527]
MAYRVQAAAVARQVAGGARVVGHKAGVRGLDDTKSGFRITLVGYWLIGLPAAWVFGQLADLETVGVWLGLLTGLAATALLLLRRYNQALSLRSVEEPAVA